MLSSNFAKLQEIKEALQTRDATKYRLQDPTNRRRSHPPKEQGNGSKSTRTLGSKRQPRKWNREDYDVLSDVDAFAERGPLHEGREVLTEVKSNVNPSLSYMKFPLSTKEAEGVEEAGGGSSTDQQLSNNIIHSAYSRRQSADAAEIFSSTHQEEEEARSELIKFTEELQSQLNLAKQQSQAVQREKETLALHLKESESRTEQFNDQVDEVLTELQEMGREALQANKKIELLIMSAADRESLAAENENSRKSDSRRSRRPSAWNLQIPEGESSSGQKIAIYHENLSSILSDLHASIDKVNDHFHANR